VLREEEGRTIQISLLSFGVSSSCQKVGYMREKGEEHRQALQLCGPKQATSSPFSGTAVYLSAGNVVTVDMLAPHVLNAATPFLLRYQGKHDN
jgi:hypothetical protein